MSAAPEPQLEAGHVGRAHGLDGSFYVTRAIPALLEAGRTVTVAGRRAEIVRRAGTAERPIIRIEGCADRTAAEALRGTPLVADPESAPALDEDEYWAHELEGCRVVDGEREVGEVIRLRALPSCEALEVRRPGREDLLVPMVADAVRSVDVKARRIDVSLAFLGEDDA